MGKRRTPEEIDAMLKAGEEAKKNSISVRQFCINNGIKPSSYYSAIHNRRHPRVRTSGDYQTTPRGEYKVSRETNGHGNLAEAIEVLRSHGIRIPKRITEAARIDIPRLKMRDMKTLKRWCKWSFTEQQRFTVGWAGGVKHAHIVCHSMTGLENRQNHIREIHKLA